MSRRLLRWYWEFDQSAKTRLGVLDCERGRSDVYSRSREASLVAIKIRAMNRRHST
jgi:hypothetical protein